MLKIVFTYEVPEERQAEYLKATVETIKPYWESHGCQSYHVWQMAEKPTTFIKEMVFENRDEMQRSMEEEGAKPAKELFYRFASNIVRQLYVSKV